MALFWAHQWDFDYLITMKKSIITVGIGVFLSLGMKNNELYSFKTSKMQNTLKEQEILNALDDLKTPYHQMFPQLDNALQCPISSRIHLFGDQNKWAIVFEILTYDITGYTCSSNKYFFGNSLNKDKITKTHNGGIDNLITDMIVSPDVLEKMRIILEQNLKSETISINGKIYKIETDINEYKTHKILNQFFKTPEKSVDVVAALRLLASKDKSFLNSPESDFKKYLSPNTLPKIMTIENWHHKNYIYNVYTKKFDGSKPSSYETFQQIAKVLTTKDVNYWKPTLTPNNHWNNWPNAGNY